MRPFICCLLIFLTVTTGLTQNIVMKDGKVIATKGVRRIGQIIMATVDTPAQPAQPGQPPSLVQPSSVVELGYPIAQIAKIDFPEPGQLKTCAGLINAGKAAEALKQIEPVVTYYESVRDVPGSWWVDAEMLKVQALAALGRNDEIDRLADQMGSAATDPEAIRVAKVCAAAGLACRGENAKAAQLCDTVLNEATRPQTLADAAVIEGQCHVARREWEPALLSLLEVPVFYPGQEVLMPGVLLGAGRAYIGLEDYARARASLNELNSKYGATPEAAQARTELERIARLEPSTGSAK